MSPPIVLDGETLTRATLAHIAAGGTRVELAASALGRVRIAAEFLADRAQRGEPIYGVTTGFGSNADKLLGARRARASRVGSNLSDELTLTEELQHNLIITHAVCVGEPLAPNVVRAMLAIRINTLLRGYSGVRVSTLEALATLLNEDVVPIVPALGSVGASGDLAPLSHLALVLLGHGDAWHRGERIGGAEALRRVGLQPIRLSYKEGLALNNGTAQMLACAALTLDRLAMLLDTADLATAMTLEAFAGRGSAFAEAVHALRPHPGQVQVATRLRDLTHGSTLVDIPYHMVPRFVTWCADSWNDPTLARLTFDIAWEWVPPARRHGRERFYTRFLPFRGGKKHQPQDSYCLRCVPQVHGAVRDAWAQAARIVDIELNSVTDNPLVFPERGDADHIEEQVISAGHFHGMPLALAMSYLKAAIPVLASISERRLNKLVDPATNDGLPAFLIGNEDATDSGFMIVQYTAAALVNDLASRAHPAAVYSIPTSANAEDHVSMGANEARHALAMTEQLGQVLALECYTAAQALDYRRDMINAARSLASAGNRDALASKIANAPAADHEDRAAFEKDLDALIGALSTEAEFHPAEGVARASRTIREVIDFMPRDRLMTSDIAAITQLVESGALRIVP